jgi:hypothetical protein
MKKKKMMMMMMMMEEEEKRTELSPTLLRKTQKSSLEDDGKDGTSKGS